jgi:hypothetical protein
MEKNRVRRKKQFAAVFAFGSMLMTFPLPLDAAERIHSAYLSRSRWSAHRAASQPCTRCGRGCSWELGQLSALRLGHAR